MLSFEQSKGSIPVCAQVHTEPTKQRFVYYNKDYQGDKELSEEERKELLKLEYGSTPLRYRKNAEALELGRRYSMIKPNEKGAKFIPFFPLNKDGERTVALVSGKSGSGKSTLAKELSHYYSKMMKVYIVSPVEDSEFKGKFVNLDDLVEVDDSNDVITQRKKYNQAKIKLKYKKQSKMYEPEELMALELLVEELKPSERKLPSVFKLTKHYEKLISEQSMWIFDDNEASGQQDKLKFLMDSQLLTGRHNDISMIILNHHCNNGAKTRNIINEAGIFSIFEINRYTSYFLKNYLELEKRHIDTLEDMLIHSRSVTVYKNERILLSANKVITF